MPLTEDQKAAVKLIAAADADEVAEALKSDAQPIYQKIFRGGHSTATNAAKTEKQTLEQQLTTEKEKAAGLQTELDELKAKAPDRAAIDQQWQVKLDREVGKVTEKLTAAEQRISRLTTDTTAEKLENALVASGFRPRIAKLLAKENAGRIKYGEDGKPVLYEAGSEIPIQVPADKSAFEILAELEKKNADPADLASNADSGGGTGGGGGGNKPSAEELKKATEGTVHYSI